MTHFARDFRSFSVKTKNPHSANTPFTLIEQEGFPAFRGESLLFLLAACSRSDCLGSSQKNRGKNKKQQNTKKQETKRRKFESIYDFGHRSLDQDIIEKLGALRSELLKEILEYEGEYLEEIVNEDNKSLILVFIDSVLFTITKSFS